MTCWDFFDRLDIVKNKLNLLNEIFRNYRSACEMPHLLSEATVRCCQSRLWVAGKEENKREERWLAWEFLLVQLDTSGKRNSEAEEMRLSDWPVYMSQGIFLLANCLRRALLTVDVTIPRQEGLGCIRKKVNLSQEKAGMQYFFMVREQASMQNSFMISE